MNQKKVWNKIAPQWDQYRKKVTPPVEDFLKKQEGKILDVGCGSGRNFLKNKEIHGVDFSKELLGLAKKDNLAEELKLMKNEKIPYKKESFDAALCVAVLHCIPTKRKRQKLVKEIYRILKPDSEAYFSVWSKNQKRIKNKPKSGFIPWTVNGKKYKRYNYIYDKDELENELKKRGFEILKSWEDININIIAKKT